MPQIAVSALLGVAEGMGVATPATGRVGPGLGGWVEHLDLHHPIHPSLALERLAKVEDVGVVVNIVDLRLLLVPHDHI